MVIDAGKQLGKTPLTSNEQLFDALVRHQVHLLRGVGSIRNEILPILNATEKDIAKQIRSTRLTGQITPQNQRRLQQLQKQIQVIRNKAWGKVDEIWNKEFKDILLAEPEFLQSAVLTTAPTVITATLPTAETLTAILKNNPFEGRTLSQWSSNIRRADISRINAQIQIGFIQGEDNNTIARRIVGTARLKGRNGVTEISRRQSIALTRTATIAYSNFAKREFYQANKELIDKELYVATLDGVTTPICRSLDGTKYPVGTGPIPPLHFSCRSLRVGLINGTVAGERPAKRSTRQDSLRTFNKKNNLPKTIRRRKDLPRGFKGKFDRFERERIRELTGRVPAKVTYQQWLTRQSAAFQDDVLGKTKGKLFRKGGLDLTRYVDRRGNELTLSQMAIRDREAFIKAGLNPDDF